MALLDTPNIGESTTALRRRTAVKPDGDKSSFPSTNSLTDNINRSLNNNNNNNDCNKNGAEQIRANDVTKEESKTSVLRYAYRPSSPAHRRIKESPLSSDAIFKQLERFTPDDRHLSRK